MIILTPSATSQTIKIVPRDLVADSIEITDESEGTTETIAVIDPNTGTTVLTVTVDKYYLVISTVFNLVNGRKYTLRVFNGATEVYLGSIFCTDQTISDYTINKNEYIEQSSNNDFVII